MAFELSPWNIWLIVAAILFVVEVSTGTFVLLCFAIGATLASVVAGLEFSTTWHWVAFLTGTGLSVIVMRIFNSSNTQNSGRKAVVDRVIGKTGVITKTDNSSHYKVEVNRESWRANNEGEEQLIIGDKVLVTGVSGIYLSVKKVGE